MRNTKHKKACHFTTPLNLYKRQTTVPVEMIELEDNSYHLIVPVEVDGIQGDMIIDTGASVTVIDKNTFPEKATATQSIQMQSGSVSGQINDVKIIEANFFKIGERKIRNMQLASIDLDYVNDMYTKHLNRKIIGLLGCDFCVKYKAIINYQTLELSINL